MPFGAAPIGRKRIKSSAIGFNSLLAFPSLKHIILNGVSKFTCILWKSRARRTADGTFCHTRTQSINNGFTKTAPRHSVLSSEKITRGICFANSKTFLHRLLISTTSETAHYTISNPFYCHRELLLLS